MKPLVTTRPRFPLTPTGVMSKATGPAGTFRFRRLFANPNSSYTTSMLRDLQFGNRIEAEHIIGFMLEKARACGLEARLLEAAYTHLNVYEAQRERV